MLLMLFWERIATRGEYAEDRKATRGISVDAPFRAGSACRGRGAGAVPPNQRDRGPELDSARHCGRAASGPRARLGGDGGAGAGAGGPALGSRRCGGGGRARFQTCDLGEPITGEQGDAIWNPQQYRFITLDAEAPDTVNPSLWRQSQVINVPASSRWSRGSIRSATRTSPT